LKCQSEEQNLQIEASQPAIEEIKPKPSIWGGWPTIGLSAAIFGVFLTVQTLVTVIFVILLVMQNPSFNFIIGLQDVIFDLQSNGLLLSTTVICSAICGFFFIWLFVKLRRGYSFKDYLEFNKPRGRQWLMIVGAILLLFIFGAFVDRVYTDTKALKMMTNAYLSAGWTPLFWIATIVFAPVFEESFFRGFLFVGLRDSKAGPLWAMIITSVTFAIVHLQYNWIGILTILFIGLVFGLVRLFSKSLWTSIALHVVWNLFSTIGVALYAKGLS